MKENYRCLSIILFEITYRYVQTSLTAFNDVNYAKGTGMQIANNFIVY